MTVTHRISGLIAAAAMAGALGYVSLGSTEAEAQSTNPELLMCYLQVNSDCYPVGPNGPYPPETQAEMEAYQICTEAGYAQCDSLYGGR